MLQLKPYTETDFTKLFKVESEVYVTSDDEVILEYILIGPTRHLHFPPLHEGEDVVRRDELWKTTCLEAFFSFDLAADSPYLEMNCSPNGDWNAYAFTGYRQGMRADGTASVVLSHRTLETDQAIFRVKVQSPALKHFKQLGITAVVEFSDGSKAYYALTHPGPQADFHNKSAFTHSLVS
ncbi:DOMON-like domain-containing protein [Bdellovibrio sp. KM01]|uniref:DOMON-like domain-containing protein n=1 Tax=Bdellovibrio sp. KM01 TaxID=2748865 RepID=UPI0015EA473D|nr:DOMON-like domain-containing protein [Bdellovibrio sp. KM01]QLY24233.1 DOMON-like domain-containing protein [Bdellovibrio sp. KM01]